MTIFSQIDMRCATRFPKAELALPLHLRAASTSSTPAAQARPVPLAQHRKHDHVVPMPDAAVENGILKLKFETAGRANTSLGGKCPAEHRAAIRQSCIAEATLDEFGNRKHRVQRTFLIQHALAIDPRERA